jgi:phosphoglycolate phosphatase
MTIRALLLDKDGTLVDFQRTWGPAAHDVMLQLAAGDAAAYQRLAAVSGFIEAQQRFLPGSPLVAGATADWGPLWARVLGQRADAAFFAELDGLFLASGLDHLTPIGDPCTALTALRRRGLRLGLFTNDGEASARAQMARLGVDHLLDFIAGYDSGYGIKPEPGPVLAFARLTRAAPSEIAVIGDSVHDLAAASAAGAVGVAVLTGPVQADVLAPHADAVLDSVAEVEDWLSRR